jgi:hypothetical protein
MIRFPVRRLRKIGLRDREKRTIERLQNSSPLRFLQFSIEGFQLQKSPGARSPIGGLEIQTP